MKRVVAPKSSPFLRTKRKFMPSRWKTGGASPFSQNLTLRNKISAALGSESPRKSCAWGRFDESVERERRRERGGSCRVRRELALRCGGARAPVLDGPGDLTRWSPTYCCRHTRGPCPLFLCVCFSLCFTLMMMVSPRGERIKKEDKAAILQEALFRCPRRVLVGPRCCWCCPACWKRGVGGFGRLCLLC